MKALPLVLAGSLVFNAVLLAAFVRPSFSPAARASDPTATLPAPGRPPTGPSVTAAESPSGKSGVVPSAAASTWRDLHTADLPALIAQLQADGCPPQLLRAIVGWRLHEQFAVRRRALFANLQEPPYWQARNQSLDPKLMAAQRKLSREYRQQLEELLGPAEAADDPMAEYWRQRQYGNISPAKAEQLREITSDYSELRSQVYSEANGLMMPEDRQKLAFLEAELRRDLAQVLTSGELENYELRSSSTAQNLRHQLTTFDATADEFRALFHAARAVEEQFGAQTGFNSMEQAQQRQAAFLQAAGSTLSPERLAQLTQATDPRYQTLNRIVARYELPTTIVPQIASVQQSIQESASLIRRNRSLSAADRTTQLTALAQEANTSLEAMLGPKAFEAYKQNAGGWMRSLVPSPPPQSVNAPGTTTTPSTGTPGASPKT